MSVQEADMNMTQMALGSNDGQINPTDYENLFVRFVLHPHPDRRETQKAGRPIFKDIPYVDIRTPGDRTSHIFRPANDLDKRKWPKHWEAFVTKKDQPQEGTLLEHWPLMSRSMVEELKYFGVRTVEQLANMNDTNAQNFMGIRSWIAKAQAFLAVSKKSAAAEEFANELAKRDAEIAELKSQVSALMQQAQLPEAPPVPTTLESLAQDAAEEDKPDEDLAALQELAEDPTEDELEEQDSAPVAEEFKDEGI